MADKVMVGARVPAYVREGVQRLAGERGETMSATIASLLESALLALDKAATSPATKPERTVSRYDGGW